MSVRLQSDPFDPGAESNRFLQQTAGAGAAVTFTGLVRVAPGDDLVAMTLEHWPEMAQRQLERLQAEAIARFDLLGAEIIHRYGRLLPGEPIVQVMTLAAHRQAAFDGANFMMDTLKTDAPFWKKEERGAGEAWVAAKGSDDHARDRWRK